MSTWVLIGCLAISVIGVAAALVHVGRRGWRLAKTGMAANGRLQTAAVPLQQSAAAVNLRAQQLSERGAELSVAAEALKSSLHKLQIVLAALQEAFHPLMNLRRLFRK
jgi:hypothetical protein